MLSETFKKRVPTDEAGLMEAEARWACTCQACDCKEMNESWVHGRTYKVTRRVNHGRVVTVNGTFWVPTVSVAVLLSFDRAEDFTRTNTASPPPALPGLSVQLEV